MLFAEEPGLVLEVQKPDLAGVLQRYRSAGLHCLELGHTGEAGPHAMVRKPGEWGLVGSLSKEVVGLSASHGGAVLSLSP